MGSPLSPVIADLVLHDLEIKVLKRLSFFLSFYYCYVDDIVLVAPRMDFQNVLHIFNSYHPRLKFTLKVSENNKICFLLIL